VIKLARHLKIKVAERPITIHEVIESSKNGKLQEAFASGTAAIISPVGQIHFSGRDYSINNGKAGPMAEKLYNEILQIQYGLKEDPFGWRVKIFDGKKTKKK
jgi:branched-chain amino acid aminotransferase